MIPVMYRPSLIGAATLVPSMDLFANLLPVDIFLFLLADFCQVKKSLFSSTGNLRRNSPFNWFEYQLMNSRLFTANHT